MLQKNTKYASIFTIVLLFCSFLAQNGEAKEKAEKQTPQIIVFHSTITTLEWTEKFNLGLSSRILQSPFANATVTCEYIDLENTPPSESGSKHLSPAFLQKYDLVIAADNVVFNYLHSAIDKETSAVPVIFCDLVRNESILYKDHPNITIVQLESSILDTIQAAAKMFPARKKMLVTGDNSSAAAKMARDFVKKKVAESKCNLQIEYDKSSTLEDLLKKVESLNDEYTILHLSYKQDVSGMQYSYNQSIKALCQCSKVPVFGLLSNYSGTGIIGGKLANSYDFGKATGDVAIKILSRQIYANTNAVYMVPNFFEFDWNVMRHFGVKESDLPERSNIINKPASSYAQLLIWSSVILFIAIFQGIIIIAILYSRKREKIIGKALREQETQWRSLTENLPDIIFRINSNGNYCYINQAIERTLHIKAEDMIGKTARHLKMPDAMQFSESNDMVAVFKDGIMRTREDVYSLGNGKSLILESRLVPERDEKGTIENILCISRDVTSQRMAEKELNMRQFVIENSTSAILILRSNGSINFSNEAAANLLGFSQEKINNTHIHELNFDKNRKKFPSLLQRLKMENHFHRESIYTRPDGTPIPVDVIFNYFSVEKDEFVCIFLLDIAERKANEAELKKAKEKAELSDRLKSVFLANMSHEVRTPLNGILGFAELLKYSSPDPEEQQKFIDIIYDSGNTLLKIIDDILDISKIESGQIKVVNSNFKLNKLIQELYEMFRHKIIQNNGNLELRLNIPPEANPTVFTDEIRLRQILTNLIGNAMKFTKDGFVEIGYYFHDRDIVMYVKDTGIGIPPDKYKTIFEPFRQAEDTISRTYGGTGLGLSIAKSYAKLIGSEITLESVVGKGTTFFLKMKTAKESYPEEDLLIPLAGKNFNWENKKILIVEDDKTSFLFLNKILSATNANIIHAESGLATLQAMNKHTDLNAVLMDLKLPDANGLELTRHIKALYPELPVIIQTADVMLQSKHDSKKSGCDGFLTKPIHKNELLQTLDQFLTPLPDHN